MNNCLLKVWGALIAVILLSACTTSKSTVSSSEKLLLVKFGVNVQPEETIVIINFIDYLTGRPVASCRGAYSSLGITGVEHDINSAINRVAKQISETFAK